MRSPPRLALRFLSILALTPLVGAGCASLTPTPARPPALDCAALIPPSYRAPIPGTALPDGKADAGDLWTSLDDQTARLDRANGRTADLVSIADQCQAQQVKVAAALKPRPWWKCWGD